MNVKRNLIRRSNKIQTFSVSLIVLQCILFVGICSSEEDVCRAGKPNIIFIMADDAVRLWALVVIQTLCVEMRQAVYISRHVSSLLLNKTLIPTLSFNFLLKSYRKTFSHSSSFELKSYDKVYCLD